MISNEKLGLLCFECTQCGRCCGNESGYVLLTELDFLQIQKHFFEVENWNDYLHWVLLGDGEYLSLKEQGNYDCIFLEEKGCSIYQDRPMQCRLYPFWNSVIKSEYSWKKESRYCPGINQGNTIGLYEVGKKIVEQRMNPYLKKSNLSLNLKEVLKEKKIL